MKVTPGRTAEGLAAVASYHTLSHEVGKVASAMAARCLVLNHFVPVKFDRAALLAEVRRDYGGPIVIGEDLMNLDLATGALLHANGMVGIERPDALSGDSPLYGTAPDRYPSTGHREGKDAYRC